MTDVGRAATTDFILSNSNFLEYAFDVEDAMLGGPGKTMPRSGEGVRQNLIRAILESLKERIVSQLDDPDWEIKVSGGSFPLALWGALTIRRKSWPKLRDSANGEPVPVAVRLWNSQGNWQWVQIGFVAPRFEFLDPRRANLTAALLPAFTNAHADDYCVASESANRPFDNWWDRGFLIDFGYTAYRAQKDGRVAQRAEIDALAGRLVGVAQAAANAAPVEWSLRQPVLSPAEQGADHQTPAS